MLHRITTILTTLALGVSLWAIPAWADQQALSSSLQTQMAMMIRAAGYNCDRVTMSRADRLTERGQQWQIDCNDSLFQYRVILTPNDRLTVRPWRE